MAQCMFLDNKTWFRAIITQPTIFPKFLSFDPFSVTFLALFQQCLTIKGLVSLFGMAGL